MEYYKDAEVKCPFYIKGGNGYIQCEGVDDCSSIRLLFTDENDGHPDANERNAYLHYYCEEFYEQCQMYKLINQKYEEKK